MKQEILFLYPFKFSQSVFSISPKVFYAVDMIFAVSEFIFRVLRSIMSFSPIIYESVISLRAIRINNTLV